MTNHIRIWISVYLLATLLFIGIGYQFLETTRVGREISHSLWGLSLLHYSKILDKVSRKEGRAFEQVVLKKYANTLSDRPTLSHSTGIYPDGVAVTVSLPPNTNGYFSLDGSIPNRRHNRVSGPIQISESTVLRVRSFDESSSSQIVNASYIVTELTSIAVVTLVMDPVYLFNRHAGIYSNPKQKGRAWERPATLSIIDPASDDKLEVEVRVRIHGGASRGFSNSDRKSLRVTLSRQDKDLIAWMGTLTNTIAPDQSEWVLRHVGNQRMLWSDRFALRIAHQLGLAASVARPIVLYLNGKPWGVYDFMERVNEEFVEGKESGQDFTLLHGAVLGDYLKSSPGYAEWNRVYRFIYENDLSDPVAYAFVKSQIDIKSLIDYYALSIFMADWDRPQNNMDIFRKNMQSDGRPGKWKFAVWDYDGGLNYRGMFTNHDTLAWNLRSSVRTDLKPVGSQDDERLLLSTRLLKGLMRNADFRDAFKQRFNTLLATTFAVDNLHATLGGLLSDYAEVLPLERQRFAQAAGWLLDGKVRLNPTDKEFSYDDRMTEILNFISERPGIVGRLLKEYFDSSEL